MKTFNDLKFEPHPGYSSQSMRENYPDFYKLEPIQAAIEFKNGYGVSVIQGSMCYTSNKNEYEVAIIGKDKRITYNSGLAEDVVGHLTKTQVTNLMKKIQKLK